MPLHFAYGSNMDVAAMAVRCPQSRPVGLSRLVRHRFAIGKEGYATVLRDPRRTVWGLLWDVALADVAVLDRYESLGSLYAKATHPVLTPAGPRRALVYVARGRETGPPLPGYLEALLAAGRAAGLPADYLREVEAWSPNGPSQPAGRPAVRPLFSSPLARPGATRTG